jgi:hypothetical protein
MIPELQIFDKAMPSRKGTRLIKAVEDRQRKLYLTKAPKVGLYTLLCDLKAEPQQDRGEMDKEDSTALREACVLVMGNCTRQVAIV